MQILYNQLSHYTQVVQLETNTPLFFFFLVGFCKAVRFRCIYLSFGHSDVLFVSWKKSFFFFLFFFSSLDDNPLTSLAAEDFYELTQLDYLWVHSTCLGCWNHATVIEKTLIFSSYLTFFFSSFLSWNVNVSLCSSTFMPWLKLFCGCPSEQWSC